MKILSTLLVITALCAGFIVGALTEHFRLVQPILSSPYEFHSGAGGQIIWRCNRDTGEISTLTTNITAMPAAAYEMWRGEFADYLLNKQTGEAWRYYKNKDGKEGFAYLMEEYPYIFKESSVAANKALTYTSEEVAPQVPQFDPSKPFKVETAEQFLDSTDQIGGIKIPDWATLKLATNPPAK